ncbi:leucine-rich repeat protein [Demequina flava]|uniref:leucine-rich repeat protein n=1 Tax=Demequina flava TaxID=1095025 RepID=UPI001F413001|nr:leucine-rich repeat protein [Demequina flava]
MNRQDNKHTTSLLRRTAAAIATIALASAGAVAAATPASALTDDTYSFTFEVVAGEAHVTGCNYSCATLVEIPATLSEGGSTYPAVAVADGAFEGEYIQELTIAEGVTSIGFESFRNNRITSLTFPSTLTSIGEGAFRSNSLTAIVIPSGVQSIGEEAFRDQWADDSTLTFEEPSTVTSIGESAFSYASLTGRLEIPDSVTSLGGYAFSSNKLTDVRWPDGITAIPEGFISNNPLGEGASSTVEIPSTVTSIGNYAFNGAQLGPTVVLPPGLTTMGYGAFSINELESITFPDSLTEIPSDSFSENLLTDVTIPSTVTSIGSFAFEDNPLETFTFLGDEPSAIGNQALGTYHFSGTQEPYERATVIYDMARNGFDYPRWAPYTSGHDVVDEIDYPTSPVVTVSFEADGHPDTPSDQTVAVGGSLTEPAPLTSTGEAFLGWSTDPEGTSMWNFTADSVDGRTTLYAQWDVATYPVVFELGYGSGDVTVNVEHGDLVSAPDAPFVPGHRFAEWTLAGAPADFTVPVTEALTFTAEYDVSVYSLTGPAEAAPGDTISVTGEGFDPNEAVALELHSTPVSVGSTTADAAGTFTTDVTIPADAAAGSHDVVALGAAGQASAPLTLVAADDPDPEPEPSASTSPTASPEPSPAPSTTASAESNDGTAGPSLPVTGASGSAWLVGGAAALVFLGFGILIARRHF